METSTMPGRVQRRTLPVGATLAVAALALAACSSSSSSSATTAATPATTATTAPSGPGSSTSAPAPGSTAQNLPVTDAIRTALVAARAAAIGVSPSSYTGLTPGDTYYAYDPSTGTYWAAAQVAPQVPAGQPAQGSDIDKAQVASQDDGSYVLFMKTSGGSWTASNDGTVGPTPAPCRVAVPAAVAQVWGWPAGACRPSHY